MIPELVVRLFGLCLGWPTKSPEIKPRQHIDLQQDVYRDPDPGRLAACDRTMADDYAARGNSARRSDWSTITAKATQGKKREHRRTWLRRMGFFKC